MAHCKYKLRVFKLEARNTGLEKERRTLCESIKLSLFHILQDEEG